MLKDVQDNLFGPEIGPREVVDLMPIGGTDVRVVATDDFKIGHQAGCACGECMGGGGVQNNRDISYAPDLVPASTATTYSVAVGGSVDVSVDTVGDRDWYQLTLTAGVTYTIQTSSDGSGTDAFLYLRDSTGAVISSDDDSGDSVNSLITFTPTTSGTYYVDAGTYNDETTGTYHLFVAAGVPSGDFVPGSIATTATLALGGTVNGNIDTAGDHDFYAVSLVAGQTYLFRTAPTSAATTTTDTILTLRDSAGNTIVSGDDAGEFSFSAIRYTATTTGTYYLDVSGYNTSTGAFNLSMFDAQPLALFTNDQIAYQLTNTYWGGTSRHWNIAPGGTITVNLTGLTAAGANLAREALLLWTDTTGINFSEVTTGGQIVFDDNQSGAFAQSTRTGGFITGATVNVSTQWLTNYGTTLGTYSFQTYIHEIGHALGLGHAGNYNGNADYSVDAGYLNDAWITTVMSYFSEGENTYFAQQGFTTQYTISPMVADQIATTSLYGIATTTRTGDTIYGFNNNSGRAIYNAATGQAAYAYTVVDHGGVDTLDYSGYTQTQRIDLNAETFSSVGGRTGNVSIARGTVIENAIGGSGVDTIIGNSANNTLTGNGGADLIYGGAGNDNIYGAVGDSVLDGGADNDQLILSASGSVTASILNFEALTLQNGAAVTMTAAQFNAGFSPFSDFGGNGLLTINMSIADYEFSLAAISSSGAVSATINGSSGEDVIKGLFYSSNVINGGDGDDLVRGGMANDTVNGGNGDDKVIGGIGADILTGGAGNDLFRFADVGHTGVGIAADTVTDFTSGQDKLVFQGIDTDLALAGDQAFSFIGTGAFTGGGAAQIRYGNSGANLLVQADVDGDGFVDMEVVLQNLAGHTLTAADFVL